MDRKPSLLNPELILAELEQLKIKTESKLRSISEGVLYQSATSEFQRERATNDSRLFLNEFMDYLRDNPTTVLAPLRPSKEQLYILKLLLDCVDQGTLRLDSEGGYIRPDHSPIWHQSYKTPHIVIREGFFSHCAPQADFFINWDTRDTFPLRCGFYGTISTFPRENAEFINFYVFPERITDQDQVRTRFVFNERGVKTEITLIGKGRRIILDHEIETKTGMVEITEQWHLLGSFHGEETDKTYWIYGCNKGNDHKTTEKERVDAKVRQRSIVTNK